MSVSVLVYGANGRMGATIAGLAKRDDRFELAGVVERGGNETGLDAWGCPSATSLDELLPQARGAVIIDFTSPESTLAAVETAARHGNPMVIGTTGLSEEQQAALNEVAAKTPIFWAPNMSVGVNVLLKVLPELTRLLGEQYDIEMVELHHNQKKDAPSGTALKLAQCLADARDWDLRETGKYCREGMIGSRPQKEIGVQTIRGGDVVGVHTMYFLGPGERIEVTHQAHSRETFAQGALRAAAWVSGRNPGKLYGMADMF